MTQSFNELKSHPTATPAGGYGIICRMENRRKIPYGVINWAELVRECFIVDNTRYIRKIESENNDEKQE